MAHVLVTGSFDDLRSRDVRFLEEAAKLGPLHVRLWSDDTVKRLHGTAPRFPQEERLYFLQAIRYVNHVAVIDADDPNSLPDVGSHKPAVWAVHEADDNDRKRALCRENGIGCHVLTENDLRGFPVLPVETDARDARAKKSW